MARRRRSLVAGGCYHVVNRGNNRATVFRTGGEYQDFIALMGRAQERLELPILAFALMPNHFHLVVMPNLRGDVGRWMHWLLTTHTVRRHRGENTSGHVWQGRFKAFPVEPGVHLLTVLRYVERNPLRAGLVRSCIDWPWGSATHRTRQAHVKRLLADPGVVLPDDWLELLDRPADEDGELPRLRHCATTQQPYGSDDWQPEGVARCAQAKKRGRPRKMGV